MKFALSEPANEPRVQTAPQVALLFASILIMMVLAQLFEFENFVPLLERFELPGGFGMAVLVAGVIVVSEVFALPFLLRMRLSPLMRIASMICGWVAVTLWLLLTVWLNLTLPGVETVGFLGTRIELPVGWWAVAFASALGVLCAWVSWGLWPTYGPRTHRKK